MVTVAIASDTVKISMQLRTPKKRFQSYGNHIVIWNSVPSNSIWGKVVPFCANFPLRRTRETFGLLF